MDDGDAAGTPDCEAGSVRVRVGAGETNPTEVVSIFMEFVFLKPIHLTVANIQATNRMKNKRRDQYFIVARPVYRWLFQQ